jgi:ribosomal protein L11 methyltransferase
VNDFVGIRATFHPPLEKIQHEIIITPKMSFGTGHHATTFMMIQQMKEIDFKGKTVLDFGTGTGVLAILAAKLGAANVYAIDYDEWSITNTIENIQQNGSSNIRVAQLATLPAGEKFDIILANINLNVILDNLKSIVLSSISNTYVLLSGFLLQDEDKRPIFINNLYNINIINLKVFKNGAISTASFSYICTLTFVECYQLYS